MKQLYLAAALTLVLSGCQSTSSQSINSADATPTSLTVVIDNVASEQGQLIVTLHDNSESFHSDDNINDNDSRYFRSQVVTPSMPVTTVTFEGIPSGRYAINVVHDEDKDGGLNRMVFPFLGMPSEPYALSNNIYDTFSKGDFEDALITVQTPGSEVHLTLATHLNKISGL
ncbi:hypothetical protein CWB99_05650 [Pseudoalteromonas rubra]|uniref:DUF2141 domain-containing protein n=1 Tax=Pseudoalteromonas rubra TaxID=43658 RepID=A0A5S3WPX1_9GAMM|nr:DUF2141 domain-containing protein [Pseudoalteromonas rubra]TMP30818.1 hypothetical protein CWB99_05650 [Pseudoalteromonas rubra]TMP34186.1 hypothetical protein CWC00_08480 [Pseudoalteromonas rubra]